MYGSCHTGTLGSLGSFGGWDWVGLIFQLLIGIGLVAGLALLVFLAVKRAQVPAASLQPGKDRPANPAGDSAKEILQARYARGEINREQYELLKNDLV